ncbi:hypothetical protein M405DRAFT_819350 [Rhizopogon salebrosus TDB-379]|nr:hypothetical protein M405DRAFT_819350 [Rhizopogon salebrosus TDB-379]
MRSLLAIIIAFTAALYVNACDPEGASCIHHHSNCCYPLVCNGPEVNEGYCLPLDSPN